MRCRRRCVGNSGSVMKGIETHGNEVRRKFMGSVSILRRASVVVSGAAFLCTAAGLGLAMGQAPANAQAASTAAASTGPSARPEVPATKHARRNAGKTHKTKAPPAPPVVETHPPDPPPPDWPVNDQARPASVAWNGRDLSIVATNSSLDQILHDVSTSTGIKVEGLAVSHGAGSDQRVYGHYGPAPARDVLSQLLDGSGYNVIMVGDPGEGTPRELVLTAQAGGGKGAPSGEVHVGSNGEDEAEEPEQPEQPEQPFHRQFNGQPGEPAQPGPGMRTPQQMLQELQQQRQQQQQQAQPGQPQNN
jgi:hypothetical protein